MAPSPLDSTPSLRVLLSGALRSTHSVLFGLAIVAFFFFYFARDRYPIVAYLAVGGFLFLLLIVSVRYAICGPERDKAQPAVTLSNNFTQVWNLGGEDLKRLIQTVVQNRKPLPLPAGVVEGLASDPAAIREISPADAAALAQDDPAMVLGSGVETASS